jgi:hypothetical protein
MRPARFSEFFLFLDPLQRTEATNPGALKPAIDRSLWSLSVSRRTDGAGRRFSPSGTLQSMNRSREGGSRKAQAQNRGPG